MLVWFRKLLDNWIARGVFGLLAVVFVFWGISNVVTLMSGNTVVGHVAGRTIDLATVQAQYQKALNQAEQNGQPDVTSREQIASESLDSALRQVELQVEEQKLGVTTPDSAIRQAIDAIPAFQTNGAFDQTKFTQVLQENGETPNGFIAAVKDDLNSHQLIDAAISGGAAPGELVNQIFDYVSEQRYAEMVKLPYAAQPVPPPPAPAVLQRFWRNNPSPFTAPEYRTIKLVILSPAVLAPQEQVPQSDIDDLYARATADQPTVANRSVQILIVGNLATSSQLEAAWKGGAGWAAIQSMAKADGATALELDKTEQVQIPSPQLGEAVFGAPVGRVMGPVAGPAGMYVFKVTDAGATGPDEAGLKSQIRQGLQLQKAQSDVAQDVDRLQDALAGQTPLDQLPGDIGLAALQGTMDANGITPEGSPAPIPGGDDLKKAIIKAAFAAHVNDPAQLQNGPGGSYFALTVTSVTPPALAPYAQVQSKVLAAWTQDQIEREAEIKAASLLNAVNGGQKFDAAAAADGLTTSMTAPMTRNASAPGTAAQMTNVMFSLKPGQATMLQGKDGFTVAVLARIVLPTPALDPGVYGRVQQALDKTVADDDGESFMAGLTARDHVSVDQKLFAQIYQ